MRRIGKKSSSMVLFIHMQLSLQSEIILGYVVNLIRKSRQVHSCDPMNFYTNIFPSAVIEGKLLENLFCRIISVNKIHMIIIIFHSIFV